MTTHTSYAPQLRELGFSSILDVEGRLSLADLFPKSKRRCGIYFLQYSDGLCYIGQARDVVRRFYDHRRDDYADIVRFSFQPVGKQRLDDVEQTLIQRAERLGLPLTNKVFVSSVIGETDLDPLIPPEEQEVWLAACTETEDVQVRVQPHLDEALRNRHKHSFQKLQAHPQFSTIVRLLKFYVRTCIPAYRRTEFSFWSLSCLPSTNRQTYPRFVCLNINVMETFVIGHEKRQPHEIWSLLNVAATSIAEAYGTGADFYKAHPDTQLYLRGYRAAGEDQLQIHISGFEQVERALSDPAVIDAAKRLNLNLMRKGGTVYARSHCFELADLLIT